MATRIEFARRKLTLDMDAGTTLSQVIESVERNLQAPRPSKCTFLWFGKRDNNRQELDIHRQRLVIEQIRNLGMTANEMAVTQANFFLIPATVNAIIEQKKDEVALAKKRFLLDMARINDEFMSIKQLSDKRSHENDALEIANNKEKEEIELLKLRRRLIETVIGKLEKDDIDPWLSSYIATTLANPNQKTEYGEHRLNGLLEQHIVNEGEAKMLLAKQNAELQKKKVEEQDLSNKNKEFNLNLKKKDYEV